MTDLRKLKEITQRFGPDYRIPIKFWNRTKYILHLTPSNASIRKEEYLLKIDQVGVVFASLKDVDCTEKNRIIKIQTRMEGWTEKGNSIDALHHLSLVFECTLDDLIMALTMNSTVFATVNCTKVTR